MRPALKFVFLLAATSLAIAEEIPCAKEYDQVGPLKDALRDPAVSSEKKNEYKARLAASEPKLKACIEAYADKYGQEAAEDLYLGLGG